MKKRIAVLTLGFVAFMIFSVATAAVVASCARAIVIKDRRTGKEELIPVGARRSSA